MLREFNPLISEQTVLASMLYYPEALASGLSKLKAEDFYNDFHKDIFRAIEALTRQGSEVTQITVAERLRKQNGKPKHFEIATLVKDHGIFRHIDQPISDIKEAAARRNIYLWHRMVKTKITDQSKPIGQLLDEWVQELATLRPNTTSAFTGSRQLVEDLEAGQFESAARLKWPLPSLNKLTGGIEAGKLYVVGGLKKTGKTKLLIHTMVSLAQQGFKSLFFSLEMGKPTVVRWLLGNAGKLIIPKGEIPEEILKSTNYQTARDLLKQNLILVDTTPGLSVTQILARIRENALGRLDCVFVDYLQRVDIQSNENTRATAIQLAMQVLADGAKSTNVPIVVASQLRNVAEGRVATIADLKESGGIAEAADVILLLNNLDRIKGLRGDKRTREIAIVVEQRDGDSGCVHCKTELEFSRFYEISPRENE
ncbi:MAG TPA: hypothetical protein EYP59_15495 [Thiotrichaceae bacterium]|nr:hypothetical protein [Thiotrichaceae bacterium]